MKTLRKLTVVALGTMAAMFFAAEVPAQLAKPA